MLTEYQKTIIDHLKKEGRSTLQGIIESMPPTHRFMNRQRQVGAVIHRLINKGLVKRVSKGVYALNNKYPRAVLPEGIKSLF